VSEPQTEWSDEALSAYLDGELTESQNVALEAALARDAALAARLEALAGADEAIKAALDTPLDAPIPQPMLDLFAAPPAAQPSPESPTVTPFPKRAPAAPGFDWRMPLAASLLLALGGVGGFLSGRSSGAHDLARIEAGLLDPANPLARLLEQTPSGSPARLDGSAGMQPVLSFRSEDGRLCREFEMSADGERTVGVACRQTDGWRLEALLAAGPAQPGEPGGFAPASGLNAAALDAVLSGLGAGQPLSAEEERAQIAKQWKEK
jgi:hypothetical protein